MFFVIMDSYIGVPESLYSCSHRLSYDDLSPHKGPMDYHRGNKFVFPLNSEGPDFDDVFGETESGYPSQARYLKNCDRSYGTWVVLDNTGALWYYTYCYSHEETRKYRTKIPLATDTRLLFPTTELSSAHRNILAGAIAGGISTAGLNELITTRCLGSILPLQWVPLGKLIHILQNVTVTKTDFVKDWLTTDDGKETVELLQKAAASELDDTSAKPESPVPPSGGGSIVGGDKPKRPTPAKRAKRTTKRKDTR